MDMGFIAEFLTLSPGWQAQADATGLDRGAVAQVLSGAGRFAAAELAPMAVRADRAGCRLAEGRVRVPEGYRAARPGHHGPRAESPRISSAPPSIFFGLPNTSARAGRRAPRGARPQMAPPSTMKFPAVHIAASSEARNSTMRAR